MRRLLKVLLGIAVIVLIALAVLAATKPDRAAHYDALKHEMATVVDRELHSNPLWKDYATLGMMRVLNAMDDYMGQYFLVYDHTFYTVGVVVYKDYLLPVSVGAAGNVWMTVDEQDLEKVVRSPDVMKKIGSEDLRQIMKLMQKLR